MTVGLGEEETKDASRPLVPPEEQPSDVWGPTRVGELLGGKYRISRFLAEGGMGVVYEAQHAIVRRRFAVKFLRPDFARRRENLGRFQREAEAAGGLESEHIASVVDFGIANDGSPYIVMEYLVGESLASLLGREGRLAFRRAADLCAQACHGAETAHAAGIVHRDLKPHNLFMCRRDDSTDLLKILDFGIAKLEFLKHDQVSTQTGTVMGTPAYMSPEQARGERTVDLRTDVYSLGAILFEMLSGKLPHPGDSRNAVLFHISTQPAISLANVAPELPKPLADIVDRALASSPGHRPQSARAFAAELTQFAKREAWPEPPSLKTDPSPAASPGSVDRVLTPRPPLSTGGPGPEAMMGDRGRRRPAWARIAVLTAVAALVAAAGGISSRWLWRSPQASEIPAPVSKNVSASVEVAPRPAEAASPPAPAGNPAPPASPRPEEVVQAPAKAVPPKRAPAPERLLGRPVGRLGGRPGATAAEDSGKGSAPAESPKNAKGSFPQGTIDPKNPYDSP